MVETKVCVDRLSPLGLSTVCQKAVQSQGTVTICLMAGPNESPIPAVRSFRCFTASFCFEIE